MQQFQFEYKEKNQLLKELEKIRQWCKTRVTSNILFQIFAETVQQSVICEACEVIAKELPNALYAGCSSNGNIIEGQFSKDSIVVICSIFEYPSTKVQILQYELNEGNAE